MVKYVESMECKDSEQYCSICRLIVLMISLVSICTARLGVHTLTAAINVIDTIPRGIMIR